MPAITQKLIDTARVDVVDWLRGKVAEQFAATETSAFFSGDGIAKPRGFPTYFTAATADASRAWGVLEHVASGANGAFASSNPADKLIDLVARMKPQYRAGAMWPMNSTTEAAVRKLKDGQGNYLWIAGIAPGQPNSLLGYPVVLAEQMPDIATNSLSMAFGNFKKLHDRAAPGRALLA
jgi:HK97 family phage major capsid protein